MGNKLLPLSLSTRNPVALRPIHPLQQTRADVVIQKGQHIPFQMVLEPFLILIHRVNSSSCLALPSNHSEAHLVHTSSPSFLVIGRNGLSNLVLVWSLEELRYILESFTLLWATHICVRSTISNFDITCSLIFLRKYSPSQGHHRESTLEKVPCLQDVKAGPANLASEFLAVSPNPKKKDFSSNISSRMLSGER